MVGNESGPRWRGSVGLLADLVQTIEERNVGKRTIDAVAGALLLLLAMPIIVVGAVGVALSLRASPFFVQQRVGHRGTRFWLLKLRTLPPSVPRNADKYQLQDVEVPWFPKLLRRLHLDELPQLLLVVTGRMSLVGPRPELPNLSEQMPADVLASRLAVRPGCTGLWQISAHADGLIIESPEYDRFYTTHANWRLDLYVVLRTVQLFIAPSRRLSLADLPSWTVPQGVVTELPLEPVRNLRAAS